jgi:predicted nucleic acid-binding protein
LRPLRGSYFVSSCLQASRISAAAVNERRGRISEVETVAFLRRLDRMRIAIDRDPVEGDVLALARRHRLSAYDAVYLELARRLMRPLLTLDKPLARAAAAEGVPGDRN